MSSVWAGWRAPVGAGAALALAAAVVVPAHATGTATAPPSETPAATWTTPDPSVSQPPAVVAEDVAANEAARITRTIDRDGQLIIRTREVSGNDEAQEAVRSAQGKEDLLAVEVDDRVQASAVPAPNDAYFDSLWGLSDINILDAWSRSTGAGVTVAVLDSGVEASHPDLVGQVLSGFNTTGDGRSPQDDANGHGTHVAGTIAAVRNNGIGVAGVAPDAKILPVTVLDEDGGGYVSDVADGISWAADHGAKVINMSLGGDSSSASVTTAVAYAKQKGVTLVAAAGNESQSSASFPAALDDVIGVAALAKPGTSLASYSNHGPGVDVSAPGSQILSTTDYTYQYFSGTSMASPHVAGVAALVLSLSPSANVKSTITSTAVDMGAAGYDNTYAYGALDAAAAVGAVPASVPTTSTPTPSTPTTTPSPTPTTTPSEPAIPEQQAQTISAPSKVKVGTKKKLAKKSDEGVAVKKWKSKTSKYCSVKHPGSKWKLKAKKKGTCKVKVVVPATDEYLKLKTTFKIKIK